MSIQEQIINDIKQLPEDILIDLSSIVKKFLILNNKLLLIPAALNKDETNQNDFNKCFPLFGCAENKIEIADDFDAPLEEMEDYM